MAVEPNCPVVFGFDPPPIVNKVVPADVIVCICASLADCLAMLPFILAKLASSLLLAAATCELYLIKFSCNFASRALDKAILYALPVPTCTPDLARATLVSPFTFW